MAAMDHRLSPEETELVAVGASVGAGCHPCVDHHLKAGANAGLDRGQLLAAVTSAERVTAEAAVRIGDHVRGRLGPTVTEPALLSHLEDALASLGAALGANDAANIERQLRTALDSGATPPQLAQAIATAKAVQDNAARIHVCEAERLLDALAAPVAAAEDVDAEGGCGCGAENANKPATPHAQAADTVGEKAPAVESESDRDTAANCIHGPAAGCAESTGTLFAPGGSGEPWGIAAAMASCRRRFERACPRPTE